MPKKLFAFLVRLLQQSKSSDAQLALAKYAGILASKNYCGTFRDATIESFLEEYGKQQSSITPELKAKESNQIVHVFTTIYTTGGHTRFLENLVRLDTTYVHHLLITEQGSTSPRTQLLDLIQSKGGKVLVLQPETLPEKLIDFQTFVDDNAAKVILHIHPHDCLPSVALQAYKNLLDIHFFNHADHGFSFGCDVSNSIINIRREAQKISMHERKQANSSILPLPIFKEVKSDLEFLTTKLKYGINETDIVAVTIGNPNKFYTTEKHHFFQTMVKGLEENPRLKLFVVGVEPKDFSPAMDAILHPRIVYLGIIEDPSDIQSIADIAIDPMPMGSYTALLETCFYGASPLVCYGTIPLFDLYKDAAFGGKLKLAANETEYLKQLKNRCDHASPASKQEISDAINEKHAGQTWLAQFHSIMNQKQNVPALERVKPNELERFSELNQAVKVIKYSTLSFFYDNIQLFSRKEVLKISLHLILNRYSIKEILGIVKKSIQVK
ncbi:MAG: hypothetical protein V4638_03700 [Bacteroidota bacterium]